MNSVTSFMAYSNFPLTLSDPLVVCIQYLHFAHLSHLDNIFSAKLFCQNLIFNLKDGRQEHLPVVSHHLMVKQ